MSLPQPSHARLEHVLELVHMLTPEEQDTLVDEVELLALRREIQIGIDQANRGELLPAEEVLDKLEARARKRLQEQKS